MVPSHATPRHVAKGYQSSFPRAYAATATDPSSNGWFLDSGATHHVTHDLETLALHSPYDGTEELLIGDGSGLVISNTDSTSLLTPTTTFNLNHILHVPFVSRNIISISKFCHDNNTFITFLPNSYIVKDFHTGVPLL